MSVLGSRSFLRDLLTLLREARKYVTTSKEDK